MRTQLRVPIIEIAVVLTIGLVLSMISLAKAPYQEPTPVYLDMAQDVLRGSKIQSDFFPIGYTAFLIPLMRYAGLTGVFVGQAMMYIATLVLVYAILRWLQVDGRLALATTIVVSLHPYLIFNIKRIVDNTLAVPLLLGFVLFLVWVRRYGISYSSAILSGLLFGCMILVRPNYLSLMPLAAFVLVSKEKAHLRHVLLMASIILIVAFVTVCAITIPLTGRLLLFTTNGAYTFFAGANRFTEEALLTRYNVEPSIDMMAKAQDSLNVSSSYPDSQPSAVYLRLALDYIKQHPFHFLYLTALKIFTFLRPDYREIYTSTTIASPAILIIVQTIIALPFFLWVFVRWVCRHSISVLQGPMVLPVILLFILPFALIGAEPRYRLPFDIVLILDMAYCWDVYKRTRSFAPQRTG